MTAYKQENILAYMTRKSPSIFRDAIHKNKGVPQDAPFTPRLAYFSSKAFKR